jgi:hypothetical protein
MNRILTKRLTLALMTLAVACLASAVFLWGTEYKVSLYPHHLKSQPAVPVAKFLSERERPVVGAEAVPQADVLALPAFFSLALLTVVFLQPKRRPFPAVLLLGRGIRSIHRPPCLIHFSFRPPPGMAV